MDKLQPLIKHRYWICFALSVVFVVVGWWMASGAIAIEIEDRMKKVDESFTKATQGATKPNKAWVDAAKKENEADTQSYDRASKQLLQRQKNARKWPDALVNSMKGISYRQDLKDTTTRARWASIYRDQIEQLLQIVKPFKDGEGLVLVDTSKISHKPFNSWRTSRPSSTEIWNCQEDIWLLESLLKSIARVNDGATRLTESQVRQIFRLHLRGGDRDAASSGGGMGGGMGGMGAMGGMAGMSMPGGAEGGAFMPEGMGMGGGAGGAASYPGKEFEGAAGTDILTEEFGAFAAGGGAQGGMSAMGGMAGMAGMGEMSMGGGAEAMGGMGGAPAEEKRYVDGGDGDTTLGYKTRAFLLDVLIRDEQVPNLLASLTNSDFPVEIVRVEIVSRFTPAKGAGGMTGGPGIGGMSAGSEMAGMSGMPGSAEGAGYGTSDELAYGGGGAFGSDGVGAMVGSSEYDPNAISGSGAMGMAPGMPGSGLPAGGTKGKEVIQAAMNDPLMVHVKIGGLMTLYQSAQEANAEAETAETDQAMTPTEAPAVDSTAVPGDPAAPADPGTSPAPAEGAPTTEGTPGQDPGNPDAPASPVSPGEPAEGVSPAPAEGTPAPAATPTDPAATTPSEPAGSEATPATEAPPADPASPPEAAPPAQP